MHRLRADDKPRNFTDQTSLLSWRSTHLLFCIHYTQNCFLKVNIFLFWSKQPCRGPLIFYCWAATTVGAGTLVQVHSRYSTPETVCFSLTLQTSDSPCRVMAPCLLWGLASELSCGNVGVVKVESLERYFLLRCLFFFFKSLLLRENTDGHTEMNFAPNAVCGSLY